MVVAFVVVAGLVRIKVIDMEDVDESVFASMSIFFWPLVVCLAPLVGIGYLIYKVWRLLAYGKEAK